MNSEKIKYIFTSKEAELIYAKTPIQYETIHSSGVDLRVNDVCRYNNQTSKIDELSFQKDSKGEDFINLAPGQRVLVRTGLKLEIPISYEIQIRPRSGLALKHGITIVNSPGTIDADYRGEIGVIVLNTDPHEDFLIHKSDRIAQAVVCRVNRLAWENADSIDQTNRGSGGFGSTGKK